MGIVTWYDLDTAEDKWPDTKEALTDTIASDRDTPTYDDKPKEKMWADAKRKRVRVVEMYHKEQGQMDPLRVHARRLSGAQDTLALH
jgi:hypothetical protein